MITMIYINTFSQLFFKYGGNRNLRRTHEQTYGHTSWIKSSPGYKWADKGGKKDSIINKLALVISNICLLQTFLFAPTSLGNKNNCSYKCCVDKKRSKRVLGDLVVRRRSTVMLRTAVIKPGIVQREHTLVLIYSPVTCGATQAAPSWLACNEFVNTGM